MSKYPMDSPRNTPDKIGEDDIYVNQGRQVQAIDRASAIAHVLAKGYALTRVYFPDSIRDDIQQVYNLHYLRT